MTRKEKTRAALSDKIILSIFPGWAYRRALSRLRFQITAERRDAMRRLSVYEAAEKNRNTADWPSKNYSADTAILRDYSTLLARARAAVRDDWAAASIVDGHVRHIVGIGITPRANARDPGAGLTLEEFNRSADRLWSRWARNPRLVDVERTKTFIDCEALAARELVACGQAFVILSYEKRLGVPGLMLQMFEPEQLDLSISTNHQTGNEIKYGIEVDEFGAPVAYWVYTEKHPYDGASSSTRILADRVLHLMRPERIRQLYGVTRLASILRELWHTKMYEEYTLLRARFEACGGAAIERAVGADSAGLGGLLTAAGATDESDANANPQLNIEPNMVWRLGAGETLKYISPETPGGQYEPFTRQQVKKIAAGAGLDYPTVSRDFSGNTYSGQRQGMIESWAETDPEQLRMVNSICRPVWEKFIELCVLEGRLRAPMWNAPEWREAYLEAEWQGPPKPWIDPQNQASASEIALKYKLITRRKIANELGEDWRENFRQSGDELAAAEEEGLWLPDAAPEVKSPAPVAQGANRMSQVHGNGRH